MQTKHPEEHGGFLSIPVCPSPQGHKKPPGSLALQIPQAPQSQGSCGLSQRVGVGVGVLSWVKTGSLKAGARSHPADSLRIHPTHAF